MKKLIIFCAILAGSFLTAVAGDMSFSGYYKSFFTGFFLTEYKIGNSSQSSNALGAVSNRLRLNLLFNIKEKISFNISYDFSPQVGENVLMEEESIFYMQPANNYRIGDLTARIYPEVTGESGSFTLNHNLDRFFITLNLDFADIYLGRQAISWGSAHFINPTDIIAPFTFNQLDVEERRGVDAVRIRIPLGVIDEIDVGYVFGDKGRFTNSAFFVKGKFYALKSDITLLLLGFKDHLMLGFDITRSIGGAGAWLESALVINRFFSSPEEGGENDYFRLSIGIDYNFKGGIYAFFEYHFNSAGTTDNEQYLDLIGKSPLLDGFVYLLAKHYLNLGMSMRITPLIPFTAMVIYNMNDGSLTISPSVEYNISENIYISAGAFISVGKKPEILPHHIPASEPPLLLHSEFGAYPDILYTSFRIYF